MTFADRVVLSVGAERPSEALGFATLDEWLAWQESLHVTDIALGLERCRVVAERMALDAPSHKVITVAGTNGKGSSVAMLDAILRGAGRKVGTYTSPHLVKYNERIRIDGEALDDFTICRAFERIEKARDGTPLTYFEFGTLAALAIFSEAELDVAILEVGLGGRLDAVNIVDADVALITSIGIDHVEYLGNTRRSIALEKAGIMRPGRPAVCSDIDIPNGLREYAHDLPTRLEILGDTYRFSDDGDSWSWWCTETSRAGLAKPNLHGDFQLQNAAGVLMALAFLDQHISLSDADISAGMTSVTLAGRFQRLPGEIETIVDVAHNPPAVASLVQSLKALPPARNHILLGMLRVKDRENVIRLLDPLADAWHFASLGGRRGATSDELYDSYKSVVNNGAKPRTYDSVAQAYREIVASAKAGDRIIALGSFLVVSEIVARAG